MLGCVNTNHSPTMSPSTPIQFNLARLPHIEFGAGAISKLPALCTTHGRHVLLVTGAHSFPDGRHGSHLVDGLQQAGVSWQSIRVAGEPTPSMIDEAVRAHRNEGIDCVVGIGGGSALDAAKSIAGLLRPGNSVMEHLEGVGPELPYRGPTTPFIAVPTTAGTGSEATKNAVLSTHGPDGFKKSFRDERLVAEYALIDPDLLATCPSGVLAANGMDAFTQLLESYVSSKANDFSDALALSGIERVRSALLPWYEGAGEPARHRANMAYAALLSGITLANVGLGSVHGLASPLGAFFPIPHGVVCGTLVAEATRINIEAMKAREPTNPALAKYAHIGRRLSGQALDDDEALPVLVATLQDWTRRLNLAGLDRYGVSAADVERIVAGSRGSSMKTNPIVLTDWEVAAIVQARL